MPETLKDQIIAEIRDKGPMTFARFMDLSLYSPQGLFTSGKVQIGGQFGKRSFTTLPEENTLFPQLIAGLLHGQWVQSGQPNQFEVVEMGAGNGTTAKGILARIHNSPSPLRDAIRYTIVEISPDLAKRQQQLLEKHTVSWKVASAITDLPRVEQGVFLSNELVDNLPFHRIVIKDGKVQEMYVIEKNGALAEDYGQPSTPDLESYFQFNQVKLRENQEAWASLEALRWIKHLSAQLGRGFVNTFDYGDVADRVYHPQGIWWRLAMGALHARTADGQQAVYESPGGWDITAPVDFTSLIKFGQIQGLRPLYFGDQTELLKALGVPEVKQIAQVTGDSQLFKQASHLAGIKHVKALIQHKEPTPS